MLVDLARNESRNGHDVQVEIQKYNFSHVIHLVKSNGYLHEKQPCKLLLIPSSRNFEWRTKTHMQLLRIQKTNRNFMVEQLVSWILKVTLTML
jgi:hypothetical protein